MNVFFAPDYRKGVAYQALLAEALAGEGVEVSFPVGHRRVLPLWRGLEGWHGDLLHLHWPEKFFERRSDGLDELRKYRYPLDLALTARRVPLVLTAHDLRPHNRAEERLLESNFRLTYDTARAVVAHSAKAREAICETYGTSPAKVHVIPHGDLSPSLGPLPERQAARLLLGIPDELPVCLMFGTVEPYKGIEPVLDWWLASGSDAMLAIVGKPFSPDYASKLASRAEKSPRVRLELAWQADEDLKRWLAAADCTIFNYRAIFTSGAACLARSLGIPIVLPSRLDTIDLMEPHPLVFHFDTLETDFRQALDAALSATPDFASAEPWRAATAWSRVASATARLYRAVA